jgi:hypothetical protein
MPPMTAVVYDSGEPAACPAEGDPSAMGREGPKGMEGSTRVYAVPWFVYTGRLDIYNVYRELDPDYPDWMRIRVSDSGGLGFYCRGSTKDDARRCIQEYEGRVREPARDCVGIHTHAPVDVESVVDAARVDEARDFPSVLTALQAAKAQGFTHFTYNWQYPDDPNHPYYLFRKSGDAWRRHTLFYAKGKWHISRDADTAYNIPSDAIYIEGEQTARDYVPLGPDNKRLGPVEAHEAPRMLLARAMKDVGATHFVDKGDEIFIYAPTNERGKYQEYRAFKSAGKWKVEATRFTQPPRPGMPTIIDELSWQVYPSDPDWLIDIVTSNVYPASGYPPEASESRATHTSKRLKWHRDKKGLYAEGSKGHYCVVHRAERVSRRAGRLPWVLELNSVELRSYEHVEQAKRAAQRHENSPSQQAPQAPRGAPTTRRHAQPPGHCRPFDKVVRDPQAFATCAALADRIGPITTPTAVYKLLQAYCVEQPQEVFLIVSLDLHGSLLGIDEVARGQIDRVNVGIDDVMRAALSRNAKGFVAVHCHPSGKAKPSQADRQLTKTIEEARGPYGENLVFVDHVVIGLGQFCSIKQRKLFRVK